MTTIRPGILAVRAVNQYRRRDILTYLSLRYHLANTASRSDSWSKHIAPDLVLSRANLPYFHAHHFKEVGATGVVSHRSFHLPGANEALAEAALIDECSKHPNSFGAHTSVFSYCPASGDDRRGIYQPYFDGLVRRHKAIAKAAKNFPSGVVQFLDIKKFYPSISKEKALKAWNSSSENAGLANIWRNIGEKFISDHTSVVRGTEQGLLTGPMFSHLIANGVLRDMDHYLSSTLKAHYFRYVDDITLVGDPDEVDASMKAIEERLLSSDLMLHAEGTDKRFRISTNAWLESENDWQGPRSRPSWPSLIGDVKRYLFLHEGDQDLLRKILGEYGFRLPILDYRAAIAEVDWVARIKILAKYSWFRKKSEASSPASLLNQAIELRARLSLQFNELAAKVHSAKGFDRKRLIPKLRYCAGQLVYLAEPSQLMSLATQALKIQELHLLGKVMEAVSSRNVDNLVSLGTNAAQAAAQALGTSDDPVIIAARDFNDIELQSIAILALNGVRLNCSQLGASSELLQFALHGSSRDLMRSNDAFLRQLACLHGLTDRARHAETLTTAFDFDENLVSDAMSQLASPSP